MISALAHALIVGAVLGPSGATAQTPPAAPQPGRQLVVPFENTSRSPRVYWLTEGSAVLLTDDLQALGVPAITRDDRQRAFERLRVPAVASLSHATVIRLSQVVGAAQVVVGSFDLQGDELTVKARTIRLDTGRMSPEIVSRGPLNDIFGVYGGIARRLAPNSSVTAEQMAQGHPPLAAFEQYVKGLLAEAPATKTAFLTQALKLFPGFQRARIALWDVYTDEGEHQQALAAARQVPSDSRLSRQARFHAALSLLSLNQPQEAFNAFQQLNVERQDPALLNNLGVIQLRRPAGAPGGRAISYFGQAVNTDATDADLFFNLGYAYWLDKDLQGAQYWLREAVRRNPTDDAAHYVLGVALQAAGSTAEAAREKELARQLSSTYAEWEAKQPGANTVPRGLERVKTEIDAAASFRVESAIVASEQRDQRELATFHLDRGRRLFQQERDEEALAELRRVVYLSPYQSEAHLLLGRIYLRTGRPQEAINALKISVWSDPDNAEAKQLLEKASAGVTP
ncbi:MAG TPA: tetratricopeptide repeat protein [Vicinamibacterales bacterium]